MRRKFTEEELKSIRTIDFSKEQGFEKASVVLEREVGAEGTPEREEFDAKARAWYFAEILRSKRKEIGLTQKQLAEKIGRERSYINRIEKGETDIQLSTFLRITDALGFSVQINPNF